MKLLIATPCYTGMMSAEYVVSLVELQQQLTQVSIEYGFVTHAYDGNVAQARNILCQYAIDNEFTHILFIDDDMQFNSGHILQMILSPEDGIIGALCPRKNLTSGKGERNCYSPLAKRKHGTSVIHKAHRVGTGIMLIPVSVLNALDVGTIDGAKTFFEYKVLHNDGYISEDYAFCDLVHDAGFDVNVAMWTDVSHVGRWIYK